MNKIEKIIAVTGFVLGLPIIGAGMYKNKPLVTLLGLASEATVITLVLRDDKKYFASYK